MRGTIESAKSNSRDREDWYALKRNHDHSRI